MEHERLSYVEALKWLAQRYNIEVEETQVSAEQKQQQLAAESLYIVNQFAQHFYEKQLWEAEEGADIALPYLQKRGFHEAIIRKFGIGYAPDGRDRLAQAALQEQYSSEVLQKAGLAVLRNDMLVDNYRDRIIFPIHNISGKVIGFGARLIKSNDRAPKYINTPENELYVKSRILYGMYFARHAIDRAGECLLVEGYTDVVSLHQAGVENVVASGGTALTTEQLRLIKKYTSNLTIVYDGDAAGVKAALRGLDLALEESLNVQLVLIPDKEDPDSYVQKIGADGFRQFVKDNKKDFILFQLDVLMADAGTDPQRKSAVVNQVAETLARIDKTEDFTRQQDYIRQCSQILKIDEGGLTTLVNKFIRNRLSKAERLPFDEAKHFEENARRGEEAEFNEQTFNLLFQHDLQEKEIARVLLEHGGKPWKDGGLVATYVLAELPGEDLIENPLVLKFVNIYRQLVAEGQPLDKNFFIYHPDNEISSFAVSLLQFPYEQSDRWKNDMAQSIGYQRQLFEQDFKTFQKTIHKESEKDLENFLKSEEDKTDEEVSSAVNFLKLRKIRKMLLENQADFEHATPEEQANLFLTHHHLKQLEMEITRTLGTVIMR